MKLSLISLLIVTAVVCISVTDSSPIGPRWRARRLRNRTEAPPVEEKIEAAPEGNKEEKVEEKVEASPAEETKKEEKAAEGFDFGTLPVEAANGEGAAKEVKAEESPAPAAKEEAKPKKAAKVEEAEEAEEAEGLSAEV